VLKTASKITVRIQVDVDMEEYERGLLKFECSQEGDCTFNFSGTLLINFFFCEALYLYQLNK